MHDKRPEADVAIKGGYSAFREFRFQSGPAVDGGQLGASSSPKSGHVEREVVRLRG